MLLDLLRTAVIPVSLHPDPISVITLPIYFYKRAPNFNQEYFIFSSLVVLFLRALKFHFGSVGLAMLPVSCFLVRLVG